MAKGEISASRYLSVKSHMSATVIVIDGDEDGFDCVVVNNTLQSNMTADIVIDGAADLEEEDSDCVVIKITSKRHMAVDIEIGSDDEEQEVSMVVL